MVGSNQNVVLCRSLQQFVTLGTLVQSDTQCMWRNVCIDLILPIAQDGNGCYYQGYRQTGSLSPGWSVFRRSYRSLQGLFKHLRRDFTSDKCLVGLFREFWLFRRCVMTSWQKAGCHSAQDSHFVLAQFLQCRNRYGGNRCVVSRRRGNDVVLGCKLSGSVYPSRRRLSQNKRNGRHGFA